MSMVWITRKKPGARARTWMCLSCPCLMANRDGCKYGCCLWYEYRLALCFRGPARPKYFDRGGAMWFFNLLLARI